MLFGTGLALRYRVVVPLQKMAAHVAKVGETDNLDVRLQSSRGDEIGILARSFDGMVEKLAESREKIQAAAHRAGMAEIASEVLHNVGNAVNSANCCVELVEDRLTASKLSGLEMAALMLAEQAPHAARFFSEDSRGPKLVNYLVSLNNTLQRERCENLEELRRLQDTIRHIRDVIASQQGHARRSDFRQRVDLISLIEESLLLNATLQLQAGVQVRIIAGELPEFHLNRSRVAQVLVNPGEERFPVHAVGARSRTCSGNCRRRVCRRQPANFIEGHRYWFHFGSSKPLVCAGFYHSRGRIRAGGFTTVPMSFAKWAVRSGRKATGQGRGLSSSSRFPGPCDVLSSRVQVQNCMMTLVLRRKQRIQVFMRRQSSTHERKFCRSSSFCFSNPDCR